MENTDNLTDKIRKEVSKPIVHQSDDFIPILNTLVGSIVGLGVDRILGGNGYIGTAAGGIMGGGISVIVSRSQYVQDISMRLARQIATYIKRYTKVINQ